ncbi:Fc.00g067770.m01.CDS01 [Cosmosporella sp. VM-42]
MDLVICKCAQCDAKLGTIVNLWTQIGKKYLAPIATAVHREELRISTSGSARVGELNTVVGECKLQDAECSSCGAGLGLKCLKSPANHVLTGGQFVLRTSSIVLKSAADARRKAEPKIKQSFKLRGDAPTTNDHTPVPSVEEPFHVFAEKDPYHETSSVDSVDVIQLQADIEAQREEINRIDSAGFQVVSTFQSAISRVEQQVRQLNDSIESVRRDGDGQRDDLRSLTSEVSDVKWECQNSIVISRLDQQLQTTDRVVTELRQAINRSKSEVGIIRDELSKTQEDLRQIKEENTHLKSELEEAKEVAREGISTSKDYASEVSSLRREVKQLRNELGRERSKSAPGNGSSFSAHELDILTSNISKIGNRASQIESLQMEFELFKGRIQRLESRPSPATTRNDGHMMGEFMSQPEELSQQRYINGMRQKRTSSGRDDDGPFADTPPKRMAMTSDYSSAATASYGSTSEWGQSSPAAFPAGTDGTGPRLTKSGKIDKRSTKRGSIAINGRRSMGSTGENRAND